MAELTNEILAGFVGGQLEIIGEEYVYRGQIAEATVSEGDLTVKFKWLAKHQNGQWHAVTLPDYKASLGNETARASDIGEGRLNFSVLFVGESGTLYPPNGSKLDPARVIGLEIPNN